MTNTEIIAKSLNVEKGTEKGHCCICGKNTDVRTKNLRSVI